MDNYTVVCLVSWPLNESGAGDDLVVTEALLFSLCSLLLITNSIINIRKAGKFLSK